ncbi:hypothetical protein Tco_0482232 [Tanacetum coccineum]
MQFADGFRKEHTKSVYFKNGEDKRRGVEYVINKILGFFKEYLELGPEYLIGLEEGEVSDEGGVTVSPVNVLHQKALKYKDVGEVLHLIPLHGKLHEIDETKTYEQASESY